MPRGTSRTGTRSCATSSTTREKAKGGLALTMFGGSSNIAPDSPSAFGQIYIGDDSIIPVLREFSERVHRHGCAIMCQITHMGHRTMWNVEDWLPPLAPSVVREHAHRSFPKEMDRHDIRRVVRAFGDAAVRCKEGGLDGTELLAHGHLIHQFWTPLVNRRTDEYGGSLENRARFGLEVLEEVRRRVGDDFLVGFPDDGRRAEGGRTHAGRLPCAREDLRRHRHVRLHERDRGTGGRRARVVEGHSEHGRAASAVRAHRGRDEARDRARRVPRHPDRGSRDGGALRARGLRPTWWR